MFAYLRSQGHVSSGYLDDTFLIGEDFDTCTQNVKATLKLLEELGFFVHLEKSVTVPQQTLEHLGFRFNSIEMTVSITEQKQEKLNNKIQKILRNKQPTIREVASVIGSMVSYLPGVMFGQLHYRSLEKEKIVALKESSGNFEGTMIVSEIAKKDAIWWRENALREPAKVDIPAPQYTLCTDASLEGWGATLLDNKCGGRWDLKERKLHINVLEMKAIEFGLLSLCQEIDNKHIRIKTDNTTAVAYINNMGGCRSLKCNTVAIRIWRWAIQKNIWLSASHIEGRLNVEPDRLSREFDDTTEWMINPVIFKQIHKLYAPNIDLFASRLNHQIDRYVAWQPDPGAFAIDAFSIPWLNDLPFIFAPFSMLGRVLGKLEKEGGGAVLVAPLWPAQSWFSKLIRLLIDYPRLLPRGRKLLTLPFDRERTHPLWRRLHLMVCRVSGNRLARRDFLNGLRTSSSTHGEWGRGSNILPILKDGKNIAVNGVRIPVLQM